MFPASLKASSLSRLLGHWRGDGKSEAAYRLLARALQLLIMDGRVGLGVRLPGERELAQALGRSEERRAGNECVSTCSSRCSPYHYTQNTSSHRKNVSSTDQINGTPHSH